MSSGSITNTTDLISLFTRAVGTTYAQKPTKQLVIIDTFANTGGVTTGDTNVGTYVIQDLIPNTRYNITFKLERNVTGVWTELAESITPAAVEGVADSITTETLSNGGYWWSDTDTTNRQLYFKTTNEDGTSINGSGFGQTRNVNSPYQPSSDFKVHNFVSEATNFTLNEKGKPTTAQGVEVEFGGGSSLLTPNSHSFDAYLFFFEKSSSGPADINSHLTNRFLINPDYLGYNSSNPNITKGFLKISNIHVQASNEYTIPLIDSLFDSTSSDNRFGGPMNRDKEYHAAFMFVNTTSDYVVAVNSNTNSTISNIKWYPFTIPLGGVWSISLKNFRVVHDVDVNLSQSTTVAVEIDGIGTQGTIDPSDDFRITMTATPS